MDAFQIIQHFFTRMHCQECSEFFSKEDVELLRREDALYIVNVYCHKCQAPNGVALVGVDMGNFEALDEHDLEHAEFDMEFQADDLLGDDHADIFVPVGRETKAKEQLGKNGRIPIPEDLLMQLLAQAGAMMNKTSRSRSKNRFKDPELTKAERQRLSQFSAISPDDVLDAHHFIQSLDSDWMKFIPAEMRQSQTEPHTESQTD